jgi:hypothetical protein
MLPGPIVECIYGWGRKIRLYRHYLDVNGTIYDLADLTHVNPIYRRVMGISSLRIDLLFRQKQVVLRGIAAIEDGQKLLTYLKGHLALTQANLSGEVTAQAASAGEETLAMSEEEILHELQIRQQRDAWERYALPPLPETGPSSQLILRADTYPAEGDLAQVMKERSQALTVPMEIPRWLRSRQEQRERRLKRLRAERKAREHGFDVEALARHLRDGILPHIQVPVPLSNGEYACYCTEATHRSELSGTSRHSRGRVKDHGILILTGERFIFLGHRSQISQSYADLLQVSRLHDAVVFMAEHWTTREVFEVPRPLESTMYLEHLLQRFQNHYWINNKHRSNYVIHTYSTAETKAINMPNEEINTVQSTNSWNLPETGETNGKAKEQETAIAVESTYYWRE